MAVREPDEIQLKRYERLLQYSQDTFDFYLQRWDESDAKVGRFITMLLALLGAGVFNVRSAVAFTAADSWWGWLSLDAYALFGVCTLASFGFFLRALYHRRFEAPVADEPVVLRFFDDSKYVDVLVELAVSYLASAREAAGWLHKSDRAGRIGYLFFLAALLFGLMSAAGYARLSAETNHAERRSNFGGTAISARGAATDESANPCLH